MAAVVVIVALTYLLGRVVVYLYVFDPIFSRGETRAVPGREEAIAFGHFVGTWVMPAAFFVLVLPAAFALAQAGSVSRVRDGALVGLAAVFLHQLVGLYFGPFDPAEAVTYSVLGVAGGMLGAAGGRRTLDAREALRRASLEIAAARDPGEIVSAVGGYLAGPDAVGIHLYGTPPEGDEADDRDLVLLASWRPSGRPGGRTEELLLRAATSTPGKSPPLALRADGISACEREGWERAGVASALLVPLATPAGGRVGVLAVASRRGRRFRRGFTGDETRAYEAVGTQAALVLENLRLAEGVRRAGRKAGVLEERQRLAREIHDTVAQAFTSVVTNLEAAEAALPRDPPAVRRHLGQIGRAARGGLDEARRLVWALGPAPLEARPLPDAIGEVLRDFSDESGIPASLSVSGEPDALPGEAEAALLRAGQETLQNVRKHAGARRVALTLSWLGDAVALDVRDDGVGFDPGAVARNGTPDDGGFGLRAMRERVEGLGGSLVVESRPDEGTTVVVELPVAGNAKVAGAP